MQASSFLVLVVFVFFPEVFDVVGELGVARVQMTAQFLAVLGHPLLKTPLFPMAQLPSGGFILLALVMCVWRAAAASVKQQMSLGAEHL